MANSKNEMKIKMIESYLKLHHELNSLRDEYLVKKQSMNDEERKDFYAQVEQIKFNIKTRETILPSMTS